MRFQTVLFDLDGTLVDSIELIIQAAQHAFQRCSDTQPSREEIVAGIGQPLAVQFRAYAKTDAELARYVAAYREYQLAHHDALTKSYEGVRDLVVELSDAGRSLGVVTSKIEPLAHRALRHVGLDPYFPVVVGLESTDRHKPHPAPLHYAMGLMDARPQSTVYIGDSPFDLEAARGAGIAGIGVTWGAFAADQLLPQGPMALAPSAAELREVLFTS